MPKTATKYAAAAPEIIKHLLVGMTFKDSCEISGVSESVGYLWMKNPEFSSQVNKAKLQNKLNHVARLQNAGTKDWKATAFFLERRYPEEWGKVEKHEHTVKMSFLQLFQTADATNRTDQLLAEGNE